MSCLTDFSQEELKARVLRIFKAFAFGQQAEVIEPELVTDYTVTVNELLQSLYSNILKPVREFYLQYGGEWLLKIVDTIKPFLTSIHNQRKKQFLKADYKLIYTRFIVLRKICFNFLNEKTG